MSRIWSGADKKTMGAHLSVGSSRMRRATVMPSIPGIMMSMKIRSGLEALNLAIASMPSLARIALWPSSPATAANCMALAGVSSTMRRVRWELDTGGR